MKLVDENDPVLKVKTAEFDFSNPPVDPKALTAEMIEFMIRQNGMGLAAPQVGLPYRIFVMATDTTTYACFNPVVLSVASDIARDEEGCLSFPDLWLKVTRPKWVEAQFVNELGNLVYERFENIAARCYLHETDHLDGVRFVDRVGPLALSRARNRRERLGSKGHFK